jgi:tetratricopeptide (TPR) repeat protein
VQERLREGIAAAKAGQRERARELLMRVVEEDEENLAAWLWLSGVVDSLDDKEVCLENALELDPANEAARKGLAMVRQKKATQPPSSPQPAPSPQPPLSQREAARWAALPSPDAGRGGLPTAPPRAQSPPETVRRPASTAAAVLSGEFEQRYSIPKSELAPASVDNEFDNEYLCPYCARPTRPEDNKCRACGSKLWVKIWQRPTHSCLFRFIWAMQALNVVWYALIFLGALALLLTGIPAETRLFTPTMAHMLPFWAVYYLAMCIYSVVVVIGLFARWMAIFYLYAVNTLVTWGTAVGMLVLGISLGNSGVIAIGGFILLIALVQTGITFALEQDFAHDKRRILLRTDSDAIGAVALLDSGRRYAKRGMWALAAIHLQRAVQMMPGELDYHLLLAGVYINLKRYELADKILTQAKRISPHDAQVERLAAIVAKQGGAQA